VVTSRILAFSHIVWHLRVVSLLRLAFGYHAGNKMLENLSADSALSVPRKPRGRSRVTNGKTPFVEADGRGPWARRWRDVVAEITSDLGGADLLSEGQRQLPRRAATISIACEKMEGVAAAGNEIDLEEYGRLTDRLGRAFHRLGLERRPRDITPSLADLLSQAEAEEVAEDSGKVHEQRGDT
jgi:hypothetical protein